MLSKRPFPLFQPEDLRCIQLNKAKVYYHKADPVKVFDAIYDNQFDENDFVAIKIHFGERGNKAYLKPEKVKPISDCLGKSTPNYFFTDTNTIYKGSRSNAIDHLKTAKEHGYDFAPVIISDGLNGKDYVKMPVNLKYFKELYLGSVAYHADAMLVLTHFKGHEVTGFGGAIKNISMGLGSRSAKQQMHADLKPKVNQDKCTACGKCVEWCPTNTISKQANKKALIDLNNCIGCGECVASCRFGAIAIQWDWKPNILQEKMAEYAYGVMQNKKGKIIFVNFIVEVSPNCDCYAHNDPPVIQDVGFLASVDPVAIDQASIDLVNQQAGKDVFRQLYPEADWSVQLEYAQSINLGTREYELIRK